MNNAYDFGQAATLEDVVAKVNRGPVQGFEDHTAEYFAASYAWDGATDNVDEDEVTEADLEPHLDALSDAGAEFDYSEAVAIALAPVDAIAYKYADPTEGARYIYDQSELSDIRSEDPSLIVSLEG